MVQNLHDAGVHHHDLKADNFVRRRPDGELRLIDFEFSMSSAQCQRERQFCNERATHRVELESYLG